LGTIDEGIRKGDITGRRYSMVNRRINRERRIEEGKL
jgi:hypothetical protein